MAIVSGMEVVLFSHAQNHDLLERKLPRDVYRYGAAMSLAPVALLPALDSGRLRLDDSGRLLWFLGIPLAAIAERWKPEGADELLLG